MQVFVRTVHMRKINNMSSPKRRKKEQPLHWVIEPLMDEPSFLEKSMFGCLACYLHGRLALLLASGEEPWNGRDENDQQGKGLSHVSVLPWY